MAQREDQKVAAQGKTWESWASTALKKRKAVRFTKSDIFNHVEDKLHAAVSTKRYMQIFNLSRHLYLWVNHSESAICQVSIYQSKRM